MSPDISVSFSEKGRECLNVDGFRFTKNDILKSGIVIWYCETRRRTKCKAKCSTEGDPPVLKEHDLQHNHEPDVKKYNRQALSNNCKRKAQEDLYCKPNKIMKSEIACISNKETLNKDDIYKIRKNMYNARKKTLPPLPKTVEETEELLDEISLVTDQDVPYLLENDYENKIVIFGCKTNVNELKKAKSILIDGTFDYCFQYFKQLFTFFIEENGHYIPVLFCLLPDKKESTYKCLFGKVKTMIGNDSLQNIMVNFEIAIHNALRKTWSKAEIFGCRFHLTQSWFSKIQNLGLPTIC